MARQIVNGGGRVPYGDIFAVNTPYLDQLSAQLYADQKQRQAQQQSESERLDQEFSRSAAKIRDADVNEYADKYNQWKQAKMRLMKMNPSVNSKEYIAAQLDANRKLAAMSQFGNESITTKAALMDNGKQLAADKNGKFIDKANDILIKANQTPTSQLGNFALPDDKGNLVPFDPLNIDNYNRHIDTKGVMDAIKNAQGKPQKYTGDKYKDKPTDLQYQQPEVSTLNKPIDFYSNMMLAATKNPKDFANTLPHPDDLTYMQTEEKYNQLMQDGKLKGNWRIGDGEDLPDDKDIHSDLEKAIKYQAMTYALNPNNQPQVKIKPVTDLTAKTDRAEQFATNKMYTNDALIKGRMKTAQDYKKSLVDYRQAKSSDEQNGILNKYIKNSLYNGSDATRFKSEDGTVKDVSASALNINGKHYVGKFVTVPNSIQGDLVTDYKKVDGKDVPVYPDAFYQTDKEIIPVYFDKKRESGSFEIKRTTKPIDLQTYKSYLGKLLLGTKDRGGEVTDEFNVEDNDPRSSGARGDSNVKVNINGKVYQVPKSNLSKMDKDGVPYKVIQ